MYFLFLIYFELIFLLAYREDPDQTPHSAASELGLHCFAASDLGLHCLPMSQKRDAMLIWVNR